MESKLKVLVWTCLLILIPVVEFGMFGGLHVKFQILAVCRMFVM